MSSDDGLEMLEEILEQSGEQIPDEILDLEEFLNKSPLFAALESDGRRALAKQAKYRWVTGGDKVIQEGTRGDTFAIVKSGKLVVDASFEGKTRRLATLGPGSVVGEVAVVMGTPRTANVTAEGDVELFEFFGSDIEPLFERYPGLRKKLQELVEQRTDQTIQVFLGKASTS
jgi:CRP-like cAMP-binding protein